MTIVIHPGLAKCGSSSIHDFLRTNREALRQFQISYPGPRRPAANLARELRDRKSSDRARSTLTQLAESWAGSPEEVLVLSSELLQEAPHERISRIRDIFSSVRRDEFIIVFIVRGLIELVPSAYAQMVKGERITSNFDTFFEEFITKTRANYFEIIRVWSTVFGWDNIRVRVLDPMHLVNGNLIDDFLAILGVGSADPRSQLLNRATRISNVTPGWKVIECLRSLFDGRHGLGETHPLVRAVLSGRRIRGLGEMGVSAGLKCGWNDDRGRYLTCAQAQKCFEMYHSALSAINQHLPQPVPLPSERDRRNFLAREFMPDANFLSAHDKAEFFDALSRLMRHRRRKGRNVP